MLFFLLLLLDAATAQQSLIMSSYNTSSCDPAGILPFNLSIPMGQCLNNHDFTVPTCPVLLNCITTLTRSVGPVFPYESLVNCSQAPPMLLSVIPSYDTSAGQLKITLYALSQECWGVPVPMHFTWGECASVFALSGKCGIAGASVTWVS